MTNRISVIGLGKLGVCTAACFAYRGFEALGVDINSKTVELVNQGRAPVAEPRLQALLDAAGSRLKATGDLKEAIGFSDATFLITPTPSLPDGDFDDGYLRSALEPLSAALKKSGKPDHLFVITSTVSPGTTENGLIPLIEQVSGRKLNQGFSVCYSPEFIALGSVIRDFLNPDLVLIGESRPEAGERLETIFRQVCENRPHVARMSVVSAEITKISLNAYVTMKISFANTLANLCEKIPGTDLDAITTALGADRRIGPAYLKGGAAFGGPCFPRDNLAFSAFARKFGAQAPLAEATDRVNQFQVDHLTERVLAHLSSQDHRSVSVLGLAYKPNTPVIEESAAVKLVDALLAKRVEVSVYDPLALENARAYFGDRVHYASSVKDCVTRSSFWIIATPCEEFKTLNDSFVAHNPTTIVDGWRMIDPAQFQKKVNYVAVGQCDRQA